MNTMNTDDKTLAIYQFLNQLRLQGHVASMAASEHVRREFNMPPDRAKSIVSNWMTEQYQRVTR